jgi:hypothetical protein
LPDFIHDDNFNRGFAEIYRLRELADVKESAVVHESCPQPLEIAAAVSQPRKRKRHKAISPLMFFSSVIVATVASLSVGYLSVSVAVSYVSENTAGFFVSTVRIEPGQEAVPLSYELVERDTGKTVTAGLLPADDTVLPFSGLGSGTSYSLMIYEGENLVRQHFFATPPPASPGLTTTPIVMPTLTLSATATPTPAVRAPLDLRGDWAWVSTVGSLRFPQTVHVETQDVATGRIAGTDIGNGLVFTFTGQITGTAFTIETDGGSYHASSRGVVTGTPPDLVMSGTFTDSNNAVGTFTARLVPSISALTPTSTPAPTPTPTPLPVLGTVALPDGTVVNSYAAANAGIHTYDFVATYDKAITDGQLTGTIVVTFTFSNDGFVLLEEDGTTSIWTKTAVNTYMLAEQVVEFTSSGMHVNLPGIGDAIYTRVK